MIFNGPAGIPFLDRRQPCLSPHDSDFVRKRNFCIIPLAALISVTDAVALGAVTPVEVWEDIHATCGEFKSLSKER